jgi:hypothetical protein
VRSPLNEFFKAKKKKKKKKKKKNGQGAMCFLEFSVNEGP